MRKSIGGIAVRFMLQAL